MLLFCFLLVSSCRFFFWTEHLNHSNARWQKATSPFNFYFNRAPKVPLAPLETLADQEEGYVVKCVCWCDLLNDMQLVPLIDSFTSFQDKGEKKGPK